MTLLIVLIMASAAGASHAQSRFSVDGSTLRLETAPPRSPTGGGGRIDRKGDSRRSLFRDFRAGACRAQAAPLVPSSSWPARGQAAITVCRP
jgi:hypothetical protein